MTTELQKRATRPIPTPIEAMSFEDVVRQVDVVLQGGDGEIAKLLASRICSAVKTGEWTFDVEKLASLVVLAERLSKGAPTSPEDRNLLRKAVADVAPPVGHTLPADLAARCGVIERALERAVTPGERAAAMRDGQAMLAELTTLGGIRKAQNSEPKKMGMRPW